MNKDNFGSQEPPERGTWVGTTHQGTPEGWARPGVLYEARAPPPVGLGSSIFWLFQNNSPKSFFQIRELLFLHKNNIMVVLLKTASVRVSFIQIMQTRVQNKRKSVSKSRYDGDVSPAYPRRALHPRGPPIAPPTYSFLLYIPMYPQAISSQRCDTSPSYLLFQTLLLLFWTLICML